MPNYIVVYDLNTPGQDYPKLIKHMETYPTHWHFQKSAWIVETAKSAYDLAETIRRFLDGNDQLFVQKLTPDSAWWGYDQDGSDWLEAVVE